MGDFLVSYLSGVTYQPYYKDGVSQAGKPLEGAYGQGGNFVVQWHFFWRRRHRKKGTFGKILGKIGLSDTFLTQQAPKKLRNFIQQNFDPRGGVKAAGFSDAKRPKTVPKAPF